MTVFILLSHLFMVISSCAFPVTVEDSDDPSNENLVEEDDPFFSQPNYPVCGSRENTIAQDFESVQPIALAETEFGSYSSESQEIYLRYEKDGISGNVWIKGDDFECIDSDDQVRHAASIVAPFYFFISFEANHKKKLEHIVKDSELRIYRVSKEKPKGTVYKESKVKQGDISSSIDLQTYGDALTTVVLGNEFSGQESRWFKLTEADGAEDGKARYGLLQKRVSNGIELWKKTIFVHHDVSQEFKDAYEKLRKPRDVRAAGLLSI